MPGQHLAHGRVVVHNHNAAAAGAPEVSVTRPRRGGGTAASRALGNHNVTAVPCPGALLSASPPPDC